MSILQPNASNCIVVPYAFDTAATGGDTNIPVGLFNLSPGQSIAYWIAREKWHPVNPVPITGPINIKVGTNAPAYDNIIQGVTNSVGNQLYREGWARYSNDGDDPMTVYAYIDSQSIEGFIVLEFMVHLSQI